jgi:hypothetical protein
MYMYMYICVWVCVSVGTYVCMHIYAHTHPHARTRKNLYAHTVGLLGYWCGAHISFSDRRFPMLAGTAPLNSVFP